MKQFFFFLVVFLNVSCLFTQALGDQSTGDHSNSIQSSISKDGERVEGESNPFLCMHEEEVEALEGVLGFSRTESSSLAERAIARHPQSEAGASVRVGRNEVIEMKDPAPKSSGGENEKKSWSWAEKSAYYRADYQKKANEAQEAGKITLATGYREVVAVLECAAYRYQQAVLVSSAGKESESNNWYWVGASLQAKAEYQVKAIEAEEDGKITLGADYRMAAEVSQRAAEQFKKAALAVAEWKTKEGNSWAWEGRSLQANADYQVKAIEAEKIGKLKLAEGYREAAVTAGRAADQWKLAAQTYAAQRESVGNSWSMEARALKAKADYQVKAVEAEESQKITLAESYREAAAISELAATQGKLSAEAKAIEKETRTFLRGWEENFFKNKGIFLEWESSSLQTKADYQARVSEAQEKG